MRKNRSRLASKIGLSKPTRNLKDFQILDFLYILFFSFYLYGKNRSRLASKIGLSKPTRNLKDFQNPNKI